MSNQATASGRVPWVLGLATAALIATMSVKARRRHAERHFRTTGVLADLWTDILRMVGPMHYLQIAPVCRAWNAEYRRQFDNPIHRKRTLLRSVTASVPLLQWAIGQGCLGLCRYRLFCAALRNAAAQAGRLDVLECTLGAHHHICAPPDERTCGYAALGGQLALLQALRAEGCPWDVFMCRFAARMGHLQVLQWAIANGCPYDEFTMRHAVQFGHIHMLSWLAANSWGTHRNFGALAAWWGRLEVVQWLRAQGGAWHALTAQAAAHSGHLECLQWVVRHGCPWDADKCHEIATSSEVRAWIRRQRAGRRHAPH
ncbi:hypothetical protein JKP88DRAFT_274856 [Tribonema minus]|uniref:Ankyrin repeat domain-containing protein n=1 Tax=Tribonema minus TaxID=303371 RepID=A0A835ZGS4_9STRA|nr:hypothetical protein JKP88DRAFT_274856 [Tribonema minus]